MQTERWRHIESIYFEALERPKGDRTDFLDRTCDDETRCEVESLLAHSPPDDFLETPPLSDVFSLHDPEVRPLPQDDLIGERIGHYCVERRIASGGMGAVYLGERVEGDFEQQVAIKVVKRGMDTEEILRRFYSERRAVAQLNHPNIARLFDGGVTADGRPYLIMEFVDGVPIDAYCDDACLNISDRLKLFRTVCDAVSFAHRSLVVHRDLKPSNILVTRDGVPKLLDFGISKVLRPELAGTRIEATATQANLLTPEFASPEQIRGEPVTTSTDVYSLGVILYEMLCGHRPYRLGTRLATEIEKTVLHTNPLPPSTRISRVEEVIDHESGTVRELLPENIAAARSESIQRLRSRLQGDIDNIVLMTLRKEADRRFASVDELARDIENILAHRPVTARRDSLTYRTTKFIRRNRVGVAAAALTGVSILLSTIGVAWQAQRAASERDDAIIAFAHLEEVVRFLEQMLSRVSPEHAGPDATIREALDQAALQLEEGLDLVLPGGPRSVLDVEAHLRGTIGRCYMALGDHDTAEVHLRLAYQRHVEAVGVFDDQVLWSMNDLATVLRTRQHNAEAEILLREAVRISRKLHGDRHTRTAQLQLNLARSFIESNKSDEARDLLHASLETVRAIPDNNTAAEIQSLLTQLDHSP